MNDNNDFDDYGYAGPHPCWVDPNNTRTKSAHPYSYSEFFHFGSREAIKEKDVHGDYSDRLQEWEPEKYARLWKEHVFCPLDRVQPAQMSAFLSAYFGKKVEAVAFAEGCNVSNGYPYYVVWHRELK
jgi:hypothetical protein